jgi:hypothetical protein
MDPGNAISLRAPTEITGLLQIKIAGPVWAENGGRANERRSMAPANLSLEGGERLFRRRRQGHSGASPMQCEFARRSLSNSIRKPQSPTAWTVLHSTKENVVPLPGSPCGGNRVVASTTIASTLMQIKGSLECGR